MHRTKSGAHTFEAGPLYVTGYHESEHGSGRCLIPASSLQTELTGATPVCTKTDKAARCRQKPDVRNATLYFCSRRRLATDLRVSICQRRRSAPLLDGQGRVMLAMISMQVAFPICLACRDVLSASWVFSARLCTARSRQDVFVQPCSASSFEIPSLQSAVRAY